MLTRGQFLKAAGGGVAGLLVSGDRIAAAAVASSSRSAQSFHSRPDLRPPVLSFRQVSEAAPPATEGYLFLAPTAKPRAQAGALIADTSGQVVWFQPVPPGSWVSNFGVQEYQGQPALAWWEGVVRPPGYGRGHGVIRDASYQQIAVVRAARGQEADLHEFQLTPQGTALITCHPQTVPADLSGVGGPARGQVLESIVQEIDVASGRLLFEWRSLDHIGIEESYEPPAAVYDYLHVNSIDQTPDGHLLISGRSTCALYKIHRRTGEVLWRLGGRRSNFAMGRGARFNWQHHARHLAGNVITVFDNGAGPVKTEPQSRGLVLELDLAARAVRLVRAYRHPKPVLTSAMGDVQVLADGNAMVGYGLVPILSEFAPDGQLLCQLSFPWGYNCYRGFRMPWSGTPSGQPVIAAGRDSTTGGSAIYASWNGATAVASWRLDTGTSASDLQPAGITPRSGFETAIPLAAAQGYAAVDALDSAGAVLGSSAPLAL